MTHTTQNKRWRGSAALRKCCIGFRLLVGLSLGHVVNDAKQPAENNEQLARHVQRWCGRRASSGISSSFSNGQLTRSSHDDGPWTRGPKVVLKEVPNAHKQFTTIPIHSLFQTLGSGQSGHSMTMRQWQWTCMLSGCHSFLWTFQHLKSNEIGPTTNKSRRRESKMTFLPL